MKAIAAILIIKLVTIGMMTMNGNLLHYFNLPYVLFIVIFTLAMTLLCHDLDRLCAALKGIRYIFTQDIIGGHGARQLAQTYQSQIQFCYGAGAIVFLIGCVAIFEAASNNSEGFNNAAMAGLGVNFLPILYATMICEGLLRPLKIKLLAADQGQIELESQV